jgi:isocitrate lyase
MNQFTARPYLLEFPGTAPVSTLDAFGHPEFARLFINASPVVMSLEGSLQLTQRPGRYGHSVLLPMEKIVHKLELASQAAAVNGSSLRIFASTGARDAVAITADTDPRDRRYLSGSVNSDRLPVYCGGLDAAIARAKIFARHADVVCLKTNRVDMEEARRFASELHSSFPNKQLGFEYAPRPDNEPCNEVAHAHLQAQLQRLGFDHYFVTQFGSTVYPFAAPQGNWVLFDDAAPAPTAAKFVDREHPLSV